MTFSLYDVRVSIIKVSGVRYKCLVILVHAVNDCDRSTRIIQIKRLFNELVGSCFTYFIKTLGWHCNNPNNGDIIITMTK